MPLNMGQQMMSSDLDADVAGALKQLLIGTGPSMAAGSRAAAARAGILASSSTAVAPAPGSSPTSRGCVGRASLGRAQGMGFQAWI